MATPEFVTGTNGNITIPIAAAGGLTVAFDQWTFNMSRPLLEMPATFADTRNGIIQVGLRYKGVGSGRAYYSGVMHAFGTAGMDQQDGPPESSFVLLAATGDSYTFDGLITSMDHTCEMLGVQVMNIAFESSGEIVIADAA